METSKPVSRLHAMLRQLREALYAEVKAEILAHPERTYSDIAKAFSISSATVQRVAQRGNISRPVGPRPKTDVSSKAVEEANNE